MAAHSAVGSFAREVRADMTALSASTTAAATSGTGLVRQDNEDLAYASRRLSAADDGGPDCELARSSKTARPTTPARSLTCSHSTWTAGQAVRLLYASGPTAVAWCARRTQRGPRRPTALECTNFAHRGRRRSGRPTAQAARPYQEVPADPVALCELRQCGACPLPPLRPSGNPRPQISRDTRSRDPPGTAAALLAAGGARAIRRTLPLAPTRSIRAQ